MNREPTQYRGDIAPDGTLHPFRVDPRDGVSKSVKDALRGTSGIELVEEGSARAQGLIIRDKSKFKEPGSLDGLPDASYIIRAGVGVDNINMQVAADAGIATVNTPGASTDPVALRALTLIQAWAARLRYTMDALRRHEWPKGSPETQPIDLTEKRLGVIGGAGRIGEQIRRRAADIFGEVLWSDLRADADGPGKLPTDELLRQADVIALAVDGGSEILTPEMLALIRDGSLVVNTSRGTNVNLPGLLAAMKTRGLHAALDVFPGEGADMFAKNPLIGELVDHPNFIGTPHTAASDPVAQRELGREAVARMVAYAHEGTINPAGIAKHTLHSITLENGHVPGVRTVITHKSVPGMIETNRAPCTNARSEHLRNGEQGGPVRTCRNTCAHG